MTDRIKTIENLILFVKPHYISPLWVRDYVASLFPTFLPTIGEVNQAFDNLLKEKKVRDAGDGYYSLT